MSFSTQRLATSSALALMAEVFAISDAVRAVVQPPAVRFLLFGYALRFRLISSVRSQRPEETRAFGSRRFGLILRNEARLMTGGYHCIEPTGHAAILSEL